MRGSMSLSVPGGAQDELEEVGASPFKVEKLLYVRGHAYSMLGCGHPHFWHEYFRSSWVCTRRLRLKGTAMPNVKVAMAEFFELLLNGTTADDALHTILKECDVLRRLLCCPPKLPRRAKGPARSASRSPASLLANARGRVKKPTSRGNVSLQWLPSWELQVRRDLQIYSPLRQLL